MTVLAVWSLIQAQWTDPGAVPLGARPLGVSAPRTKLDHASRTQPTIHTTNLVERLSILKVSKMDKKRVQPLFVPRGGDGLPKRGDCAVDILGKTVAQSRAVKKGVRRCPYCGNNYQPVKARHDFITGRCIVKLNHYRYVDENDGYM